MPMLALTIMASSYDMLHTHKAYGVEAYRQAITKLMIARSTVGSGSSTDRPSLQDMWVPGVVVDSPEP